MLPSLGLSALQPKVMATWIKISLADLSLVVQLQEEAKTTAQNSV